MSKVNVKYKYGTNVKIKHQPSTQGIVTAIFIRGRGRAYEVSYTGNSGPTQTVCEEVELESCGTDESFGF
ncbi:hypothetical protein LCGC14_0375800 [marine sediment metagenome]|uniref:Uncharacterized protein n=1 Tax=marine sediment metagenome TaxID=412755 RepID=A0A0F9TLU9_9ZZZZ